MSFDGFLLDLNRVFYSAAIRFLNLVRITAGESADRRILMNIRQTTPECEIIHALGWWGLPCGDRA